MTLIDSTPHSSLEEIHQGVAELEDEAITIIREVAAECRAPVLLFSGGKDSAVLLHLAAKAFRPGTLPFPVMHVDTGHNFDEVIDYRDILVEQYGVKLIVASVQESIDSGRAVEETGPRPSRNRLQSVTLLDAIAEHQFDAAFGGVGAMKTRREPKSGFCPFAIASVSGSHARNALNHGTCSTQRFGQVNICVLSRFQIGLSWIFGVISALKMWPCRQFIFRIGAPSWNATECC